MTKFSFEYQYSSHIPKGTGAARGSLEQRLFVKMLVSDSSECWEWTAFKNPKGYGMIKSEAYGQVLLAHRKLYEIYFDVRLNDDDDVHHSCENKGCMNPTHFIRVHHNKHKARFHKK